MNYDTIIVDLERRQVVDLLADRSAATAGSWFESHPKVAVVSRDRAGICADAARQGAPRARQVADRFHLLQNFRETVERQLGPFEAPISDPLVEDRDDQATPAPSIPATSACASDTVTQKRLMRRGRQAERQELFDEIRALFESGSSVGEIARKFGLGRRRVERWVRVPGSAADQTAVATQPARSAFFTGDHVLWGPVSKLRSRREVAAFADADAVHKLSRRAGNGLEWWPPSTQHQNARRDTGEAPCPTRSPTSSSHLPARASIPYEKNS
jgi:Transposase